MTLVVGCWQYDYFRRSFALSERKLRVLKVDVRPWAITRNAWYLFDLPKLIAEHAAEILHLSFPTPFVKRQISVPVVSTIHDLYPYDLPSHFGRLRVRFNRCSLRVCIEGSEHITCISNATRLRLLQQFPSLSPAKVSTVYNIVGSTLCSTVLPPPAIVGERPFVLAVAQHRKNKRLELLLHAFSELLADGSLASPTLLVLVGSNGPETTHLQKLIAKLSLGSNVRMLHGLSDAEMAWLYARCLLLASTSTFEGFNLPIAEGISAGTRVVCSDILVHHEIAGDACDYFDSSAPDATRELSDALRISLHRERPKPQPAARFSREVVIPQYLKLYRSLLQIGEQDTERTGAIKASHEARAL